MADDDDSGEAWLKNHMSEAQNSSPEGRGLTGSGSRGTSSKKDASYIDPKNGNYEDEYANGPMNPLKMGRVNRRGKGDRL